MSQDHVVVISLNEMGRDVATASTSSCPSPGDIQPELYRLRCRRRSLPGYPTDDALIYSVLQRLPMKDFAAEVRASMDVDQFLNQAVLLLDVQETSVEGIIDKMLHKVRFFPNFCEICALN